MAADPPQGRVGYVLDGFGDGKSAEGLREVFCVGGRCGWFSARLHSCPGCGWARPGFNKEIRTKQLNRHLYAMAEKASMK